MGCAVLDCAHFTAGRCRSCSWLERPYDDQLASKDAATRELLDVAGIRWLSPAASAAHGFRNKAKMVITGSPTAPSLGILGPDGGVDLRDCALHTPGIVAALPVLADFITLAELPPYDVASTLPVGQRGELKHILVTESPDQELMVRLVLRSRSTEARIRKHLPWLTARLPNLRVLSLNLQPEHRAVLEGDQEIVLDGPGLGETLAMRLAEVTLHLRPRSFFQTNTEIAIALYQQAREWAAELSPRKVVDLYCGVGGFALHLAPSATEMLGIEISADAIASATRSAKEAGLAQRARFLTGDATAAHHEQALAEADLVVVNPPRRGLGQELSRRLAASSAKHVIYSSCNPQTLARDLADLLPLQPVAARVFDMFPNTPHAEVLMLLARP